MSLLRSDEQVALNDLLVMTRISVDHFHDEADYIVNPAISGELRDLANQRVPLCERLEKAIRDSGDMPSAPDEDRESVEQLFHRLHAKFANDDVHDLLQQRLMAEVEFSKRIEEIRASGSTTGNDLLVGDLQQAVNGTVSRLQELLSHQPPH